MAAGLSDEQMKRLWIPCRPNVAFAAAAAGLGKTISTRGSANGTKGEAEAISLAQ